MTQLSWSGRATHAPNGRKPSTSFVFGRMVHNLHASWVVISMAATLAAGCPVPPNLSLEQSDAAPNGAPTIISVRGDDATEHPPGSSLTLFPNKGTLAITGYDADLGDTLFFRVFVDYTVDRPTAPRTECEAGPTSPRVPQRAANCEATTLCVDTGTFDLDIDVYDREPLAVGSSPPYRTTLGLAGTRHLRLQCIVEPS